MIEARSKNRETAYKNLKKKLVQIKESRAKRVQLEKQLALTKEEQRTYAEMLDTQEIKPEIKPVIMKQDIEPKREIEKLDLNPQASAFVPKSEQPSPSHADPAIPAYSRPEEQLSFALNTLANLQVKQTELGSLLVDQQRSFNLPIKEPPVFSCDYFEYPSFITTFDSIIASKVQTDKDRLFFLEKYTEGKANEAIKGFLATSSDSAYREARRLLAQRFREPRGGCRKLQVQTSNLESDWGWRQQRPGGVFRFSDMLRRGDENHELDG